MNATEETKSNFPKIFALLKEERDKGEILHIKYIPQLLMEMEIIKESIHRSLQFETV